MTTVAARRRTTPVAPGVNHCPQGVAWCEGDPYWHIPESPTIHDGQPADLPATGKPPFRKRDRRWPNELVAMPSGRDGLEPVIWLAACRDGMPVADGAYLTLDQAEDVAWRLLGMVNTLRDGEAR